MDEEENILDGEMLEEMSEIEQEGQPSFEEDLEGIGRRCCRARSESKYAPRGQ